VAARGLVSFLGGLFAGVTSAVTLMQDCPVGGADVPPQTDKANPAGGERSMSKGPRRHVDKGTTPATTPPGLRATMPSPGTALPKDHWWLRRLKGPFAGNTHLVILQASMRRATEGGRWPRRQSLAKLATASMSEQPTG